MHANNPVKDQRLLLGRCVESSDLETSSLRHVGTDDDCSDVQRKKIKGSMK